MRFDEFLNSLNSQKSVSNVDKINTLVFCDPGLDDALMLMQILASLKHKIMGIIPGAGNVPLQTTIFNTLRICELVHRKDIKVYPGCKHPSNQSEAEMIDGTTVYGDDGLGGIVLPAPSVMKAETEDGIQFSVETIKKVKTMLISTGGLTDVYRVLSRLQQESPDSLKNILGISIMGGVVNAAQEANAPLGNARYAEFNILFDTTASKAVFELCARHQIQIFLSSLDLTHSILCSADDIQDLSRNVENSPVLEFAKALLEAVPDHYKNRFGKGPNNRYRQPLHDVHASACLMHPEIYESTQASVSVQDSGPEAGKMEISLNAEGNVHLLSIPYLYRNIFFSHLMKDIRSLFRYRRIDLLERARQSFLQFDRDEKSSQVEALSGQIKIFTDASNPTLPFVVFGIKREDQAAINFEEIRPLVSAKMKQPQNAQFFGWAGDSEPYSMEGTQRGDEVVAALLCKEGIIHHFGYTSKEAFSDATAKRCESINYKCGGY